MAGFMVRVLYYITAQRQAINAFTSGVGFRWLSSEFYRSVALMSIGPKDKHGPMNVLSTNKRHAAKAEESAAGITS